MIFNVIELNAFCQEEFHYCKAKDSMPAFTNASRAKSGKTSLFFTYVGLEAVFFSFLN